MQGDDEEEGFFLFALYSALHYYWLVRLVMYYTVPLLLVENGQNAS